MKHPTAAWRLRALRMGAVAGTAAVASLALATTAGAQVFTAYPNPTGSQLSFSQAVANANAAGGNNIILLIGKKVVGTNLARFQPSTGVTITDPNLTITGDHSVQDTTGQGDVEIDGTNQQTSDSAHDLITVAAGAHLTFEGVELLHGGPTGLAAIRDNGNLTLYNSALSSSNGIAIAVGNGSTASLTDSLLDSSNTSAISNGGGTVTLDNVTIANGDADGIDQASGKTYMYNTVLYGTEGAECNGAVDASASPSTDGSESDDNTCGVEYGSDTNTDSTGTDQDNGGPTVSIIGIADTANKGNSAYCPAVDQRFFINPVSGGATHCDIGAVTASATQESTSVGPTCGTPTVASVGGVLQQTVPVNPSASGFGPEGSGLGDIVNSGDAIDGIINNGNNLSTGNAPGGITNGTVALTNPFATPMSASLNVTATKTTSGTPTKWSFSATDWAGHTTYCS